MEKRDLYDKNRKLIGKTITKNEAPPEGTYIQVVLIFIQNGEGKFLVQKRSKAKNGLFATTGGHPKSGETSKQGIIAEVKEEIGIDLNPDRVKWYFGGRSDEERVFWDDYYIQIDEIDIEKVKLQKEEVDSLYWFSADEIIELKKKGLFFLNHFEEFEELLRWLEKGKK